MEKVVVTRKIILITSIIRLLSFLARYLENSGTSKPEKEVITKLGNIIIGIDIPNTVP